MFEQTNNFNSVKSEPMSKSNDLYADHGRDSDDQTDKDGDEEEKKKKKVTNTSFADDQHQLAVFFESSPNLLLVLVLLLLLLLARSCFPPIPPTHCYHLHFLCPLSLICCSSLSPHLMFYPLNWPSYDWS